MGLLALHLKSYAESYSCLSKHRPGLSELDVGAGFKPALPPPLELLNDGPVTVMLDSADRTAQKGLMGLLALHLKSYAESYSCLSKPRPGLSKTGRRGGFQTRPPSSS